MKNWRNQLESIRGYDEWKTSPPSDTRNAVYTCDGCGDDIMEGEMFYMVGESPYCRRCVTEEMAERED